MAMPRQVLLFAGCMVQMSLRAWPSWREHFPAGRYRPILQIHNFPQILQIMQVLQGEANVPVELRPFCHVSPKLRCVRKPRDFSDVELALVEVSSPVELTYRGYNLHLFGLNQKLVKPLLSTTPEQKNLADIWTKSLRGIDEEGRAKNARALIETLPANMPEAALVRSIIEETRAARTDPAAGLAAVRSKLSCPIALVIRHFRYMPDGRPVSWPPDFVETLKSAAQQLNIPVFDPAPLVASAGVKQAIGDNDNHYRASFCPVMGEAITNFALSVPG